MKPGLWPLGIESVALKKVVGFYRNFDYKPFTATELHTYGESFRDTGRYPDRQVLTEEDKAANNNKAE